MTQRKTKARSRILQGVLVGSLAAAAAVVSAPAALGANYGAPTHNCYGIYWNTDWNQDCNNGGAGYAGYYKSVANCKAPQIPDKSLEKYRPRGHRISYDGPDCKYGIHGVSTTYRAG